MNRGDVVRFAQPLDASEAAQRFVVIEDRGPRTLVAVLWSPMRIIPQFVYPTADLIATGESAT